MLAILILLSVLALATVLWRYFQQLPPEEMLEALPKQVDLALEKVHYTQEEAGQRRWTLNADQAAYQRGSKEVHLDNVEVIVYRAGEFGDLILKAGQGLWGQESQTVEIWDGVSVESGRGEQLTCERLRYLARKQRLVSDRPFRLQAPRLELSGTGFEVDLDAGRMLVKEAVKLLLRPAAKESD